MHARRLKFGPSSLSKFSADSWESASAMDQRSFASQIREGSNKTPKGLRTRCLRGSCLTVRDLCSCCFKEAGEGM
jgi:hypothetical protein